MLELAHEAALSVFLLGGKAGFADDLAEVDASEEVLVRQRRLEHDGIGLHVLDVGFDERRTRPYLLDDDAFADDGFIDERVLRSGRLASDRGVVDLLLAEREGRGRQGGGSQKGDSQGSGEIRPEVHIVSKTP